MNIFILHTDPEVCAEMLCNKHLVKMISEHTQILSTNLRLQSPGQNKICDEEGWPKATHANHPCTVWARQENQNRAWLVTYTKAMLTEYTKRYGKVHAYAKFIIPYRSGLSFNESPDNYALSMPLEIIYFAEAQYKNRCPREQAVLAYRLYYLVCKTHILFWKNAPNPIPTWMEEEPDLELWASRLQAVLASDESL